MLLFDVGFLSCWLLIGFDLTRICLLALLASDLLGL